MLYKQTTTPFLFQTLQNLMEWKELDPFRLVGETGLSLQLGHRQSIDIDLFSDTDFDLNNLAKVVRKKMPNAEIRKLSFGLTIYIPTPDEKSLKIDLMNTEKFIRNTVIAENIRIAHIEDIAPMKLEAITSRNTKKDFFDISELLKNFQFEDLLNLYIEKYPFNDIKQVLENITFFSEDCELEFDPIILNNSDWLAVKFSLIDAFNDYINRRLD